MTKLEQVALAIFERVAPEEAATSWENLSEQERENALEWARAAMTAARTPSAELVIACADLFGSQTEIWETSIDAMLGKVPLGRTIH
jgi:hypothetical protein